MKNMLKVYKIFLLFLFIFIFIYFLKYFKDNEIENFFNTLLCFNFKRDFGFFLLIVSVYFFVLPEQLIIGGLESTLIFLDKIFFYKKNIQNYFFSKNNFIMLSHILSLILGYFLLGPEFFIKTLRITFLFVLVFKILDYFRVDKTFFLKRLPFFIKKNAIYRIFFSSLFIGLNVGIGCGLIFLSGASTGGTDFLFLWIKKKFELSELKIILFCTDGIMIICSFCLDLYRKLDTKKIIIIKYIFSFFTFLIAICLMDFVINFFS